MPHGPIRRAAQYLRMSRDAQQLSIGLQTAANAAYAREAGYEIVRTYADPGRSGVTLARRPGLKRLLADVVAGPVDFEVILVFDVSRWGRFQDPDEAAHYEFICRSAGLRIEYTTEVFANDGGLPSALVKQLKRLMAAEFSRDLSEKIRRVHVHLHDRGLFSGGSVPYGFERQQVGPDGRPQKRLAPAERKSFAASRVVLVPGPAEEVAIVRRVFREFVGRGRSTAEIARRLGRDGVTCRSGRPWTVGHLRKVLANELYAGTLVLGRERFTLTGRQAVAAGAWRRKRGAVPAIVPHGIWKAAQACLAMGHTAHVSDATLIAELQALHRRRHRVSAALIAQGRGFPVGLYRARFGSLTEAYVRAGLGRTPAECRARLRAPRPPESYRRNPPISGPQALVALRALLAREGRLSSRLIDEDPACPGVLTLRGGFGGLRLAYALAGYAPTRYQDLQMEARGQPVTRAEAAAIRTRVLAGEDADAILAHLHGGGLCDTALGPCGHAF